MDNFQIVRDTFIYYHDQIFFDKEKIQTLLAPYLSLQYRRLYDFFERAGLGLQRVLLEQLYNAIFVSPPAPDNDISIALSRFISCLSTGNSSYGFSLKDFDIRVYRNRDATKYCLSFFSPDHRYAVSTTLWHEWDKDLNTVMDDVIKHECNQNYKVGTVIAKIKRAVMKEVGFGLSMMKSNKEKFDQWS